ncbi:conserved hypothetical protein [Tenacibaculum amylolyticum]
MNKKCIFVFLFLYIMIRQISFFFIIISLLSCKKTIQTSYKEQKKTGMNLPVTHKKFKDFSELSKNKMAEWKEYNELNEFMQRFYNISPNDALNMASELNGLIKNLINSTKNEDLQKSALIARVNVLQNEALRLKDMTLIPAIKPKEVNSQVDKILLIFSSYNEKVNTIFSKKKFDEEIDLELLFKDIDSISQ